MMTHPVQPLSIPAATRSMQQSSPDVRLTTPHISSWDGRLTTPLAGRLARWLCREGDALRAGDPVAEIAGDRCTMDVESPESGVLTRILIPEGAENIAIGATLGLITPGPAVHHASPAGQGAASPRARRLARDHGVDLAELKGSGPAGRIVERDIRAALQPRPVAPAPAAVLMLAPAQAGLQVCLELDCEIDAADALREQLRATSKVGDADPDLLDCALRAFALALKSVRRAHVAYGDKGFVPAEACDLGLAITLSGRVVAPALRAVERLSLRDIALARRTRAAAPLTEDEAFGGSALLIDAGPLGISRLFPALSAPWTAILALGAIKPRVVVRANVPEHSSVFPAPCEAGNTLAIARAMSVTLTFDRRAIEATDAAEVLRLFKTLMENPARLAI